MPPSPAPGTAPEPLPEGFFARDSLLVAPELIGAHLRLGDILLRITETEAYRWPDDTACHARAGRTHRNAPMWGPAGRLYVYRCYGLHWMLNVVTGKVDEAEAVLLRAAEPIEGLSTLQANRGRAVTGPELLAGPGRLAAALGVDGTWNHHPVHVRGGLEVLAAGAPPALLAGPRVGIDYARPEDRDAAYRFALAGSRFVTQRRALRTLPPATGDADPSPQERTQFAAVGASEPGSRPVPKARLNQAGDAPADRRVPRKRPRAGLGLP
jgi:DNA-3-methyladenine glycosylase